MKFTFEKVASLTLIGFMVVAFVVLLFSPVRLVTRETAIEVSKNAELVREYSLRAVSSRAYAEFTNSSVVEHGKKGYAYELYEDVTPGHSVWEVTWWFQRVPTLYAGESVIVIVDAVTSEIAHEEIGILLL